MSVDTAIRKANELLPGTPAERGEDVRWQAIIAVGEFVESQPAAVWEFIRHWGGHSQEDIRDAIASCLLEHLLEYHFADYFPKVEELALTDPFFGNTFRRCWQLGQSEELANAKMFDQLKQRIAFTHT